MTNKDETPFHYHNGELYCEAVPISHIVGEVATPCYIYSANRVRQNFRRLAAAFEPLRPRIYYSVKANSNLAILQLLRQEGAGFDIVSGGELYRALKIDIPPALILFAGVGKTWDELELAVESQIGWFNVESAGEVVRLNSVAAAGDKIVNVALRLRPGVEAGGHPHISTGGVSAKFGMSPAEALDLIRRAREFSHLRLHGTHIHIGSQIADPSAVLAAIDVALDFSAAASFMERTRELNLVPLFDIGGGFPVPYRDDEVVPSIDDFAAPIVSRLVPMANDLEISIEPGRYIVADAGALVLTVQYSKEVNEHRVLVVDGGMNSLLRPALYGAYHRILPLDRSQAANIQISTTVVGPICESSDVFARDRSLPPLASGDQIAILDTGAYGFCMSSSYNSRPRPAEVLVNGNSFRLIRRRESYADLVDLEL